MQISFFNNLSDVDTINKNLTPVMDLNGTLKNDCSLTKPVIIIESTGFVNANYCYIPEFGRYYFVGEQTILSNNRVSIEMESDALESFKSQILNLDVIIENSTNKNDKYLSSNLWINKVKTSTTIVNFSNGFNDSGEYILITAGG